MPLPSWLLLQFNLAIIIFSMQVEGLGLQWAAAESVKISIRGEKSVLQFTGKRPLSVTTTAPFKKNLGVIVGSCYFRVFFPRKAGRTAIGFQFADPPSQKYLTPMYDPSNSHYISFGGAGYLYPSKSSAGGGYAEGDTIEAKIDWKANTLTYYVNSNAVAKLSIPDDITVAFPSLSVEAGEVIAELESGTTV